MSRPLRIYVEGLSVHVTNRGINRMQIFDEDDDCEILLEIVREAADNEGVDVHGFSLMKNHYHFQVTPRHSMALPRAMKQINWEYCRYYNHKHQRTGTIWGRRYHPVLIEDEKQWLNCLRYIELNPVRAGLVSQPQDYPWSSYRVHALGDPHPWLVRHPLYLALGSSPKAREDAYASFCAAAMTQSELTLHRCPLPVRRRRLLTLAAAAAPGQSSIAASER